MLDINGILNALQTPSGRNTAMLGGGAAAAGLATGMLVGKSGRKMLGKAAKYGAVAALGGLAYHAINRHRAANAQTPPAAGSTGADYGAAPENTAYLPATTDTHALDERGRSLVRAMIAAAKADGSISEIERRRITVRMQQAGLNAESCTFVELELAKPLNMEEVVTGVACPEHAAELYAASLVAIDANGPVERAYLQLLAARLSLDTALVEEIHRSAEAEAESDAPGQISAIA